MGTTPHRGQADHLELGDWNATCAQCGRKRKASGMIKNPLGSPAAEMYTCPEHYDFRQPQDFARGIPDKMQTPWMQQIDPSYLFGSFIILEKSVNDGLSTDDYYDLLTETSYPLMTET